MPRKSNGNTTTRSKKTTFSTDSAPVPSTPVQAAAEVAKLEVLKPEAAKTEVKENKQATIVAASRTSAATHTNLDEEIRRRAYELYLQRNGKAGDPNRDWFLAESEVRARHATAGHSA